MIKRIGMFGGSFNPVHLGHIGLAQAFIEELKLDKLLIVPTNIPPHKSANDMTSSSHRFNMCKIAFEGIEKVEVSDIEIKRQGASYTVDTLRQLKQTYKDSKIYLITGADMFMTVQNWKEAENILKIATVCTAPRDITNYNELFAHSKKLANTQGKSVILKNPIMQVSSTQIRNLIKENLDTSHLTGDLVQKYILENSIYQG